MILVSEDVSFLLEKLQDQNSSNQLVISYGGKVSKVARENYYPNNRELVLHRKLISGEEAGYSVYELVELLKKYGDLVDTIKFEAWDGSFHEFVNIYESEFYVSVGEYSCVIIVGSGNEVMKEYGKITINSDSLWGSDLLYPGRFFHH